MELKCAAVLAKFGRDVIMVTHSRDEAYNMSREIAVMDSGKLLTKNKTGRRCFQTPEAFPAAILTGCKNVRPRPKSAVSTRCTSPNGA